MWFRVDVKWCKSTQHVMIRCDSGDVDGNCAEMCRRSLSGSRNCSVPAIAFSLSHGLQHNTRLSSALVHIKGGNHTRAKADLPNRIKATGALEGRSMKLGKNSVTLLCLFCSNTDIIQLF